MANQATALERRHPQILEHKRLLERKALQQQRYSMGECVLCGIRLDDVELVEGFNACYGCDPGAGE